MELRIIAIGKIKNDNLDNIISQYLTRIRKFIKISIIEVNEITYKEENDTNIKEILKKEAIEIINKMENSFNIVLDINGEIISSEEIATTINSVMIKSNNYKYLNFIIGSSYGLDDTIKQKANLCISFGKITLNHQIFRLVLLEQIYRAFCIINNIKYHK